MFLQATCPKHFAKYFFLMHTAVYWTCLWGVDLCGFISESKAAWPNRIDRVAIVTEKRITQSLLVYCICLWLLQYFSVFLCLKITSGKNNQNSEKDCNYRNEKVYNKNQILDLFLICFRTRWWLTDVERLPLSASVSHQ